MNKQDKNILLDEYKKQFNFYRLSDYKSEEEKHRLQGMETMLKALDIDFTEAKNQSILNNNQYLLNTWRSICQWIDINFYKVISVNMLVYIKDEIDFISQSDIQIEARKSVIERFEHYLIKNEIALF